GSVAQDHRERRGLVLQPLARGAVAQGRKLRPRPAGRRNAGGLRSGRDPDSRRADWRGLPYRPAFMLLPQGRGGRRWREAFVRRRRSEVRSKGGLQKVTLLVVQR